MGQKIPNRSKKLYIKFTSIFIACILLLNVFVFSASAENKKNKLSIDSNEYKIGDFKFNIKLRIFERLSRSEALSLCIIKNNSIVWYDSFGHKNLHSLKKITKDTIFMISSVTKTITATALLQLYEKGNVDLDTNINEYLPFDLKNPKYPDVNVTLRMLLYHRSSINDSFLYNIIEAIEILSKNPFKYSTEEIIKEMLIPGGKLYKSDHWFNFPPDTSSYYTNIGYIVIGYIIERITGQTIEDYCQEHIFEPLEMKNTSYHPGNLDQKNMVQPYIRPFIIPIPLPNFDHKCFAAMCGVRTSVEDLSHFLIAHMNNGTYKENRILKNETIELMHTILYPESQSSNVNLHQRTYGMGWFSCNWFGDETQGHGGMNPGGIAYMMTNSSNKMGFIIISNTMDIFEFYKLKFLPRFFAFRQIGKILLEKDDEI